MEKNPQAGTSAYETEVSKAVIRLKYEKHLQWKQESLFYADAFFVILLKVIHLFLYRTAHHLSKHQDDVDRIESLQGHFGVHFLPRQFRLDDR